MGKRKSSKFNSKNKFDSRPKGKSSNSFWNNAGQYPMPAVNTDRPFDFDVGVAQSPSKGLDPFYVGNIQYVSSTLIIPDDWFQCEAFNLAVSRLYQSIRENLKSNLTYTVNDLMAYICSVMWIQAVCSTINRDFAFLNFRDAQHPAFEHIWGKYTEANVAAGRCVSIDTAVDKTYISETDLAESFTYIDNVVKPKLELLPIPPVAAEFCKWLFDGIFVDETNPSRSQWYWNEIRSIPVYEWDSQNNVMTIISHLSSTSMSLEDLVDYATYIASKYGVLIADLRRCGASMVIPQIWNMSERKQIMKYDEVYFSALRNAYTSAWVAPENASLAFNPDFFLVDFYEGMTNDQMCSALSLAGALVTTSDLVKPIKMSHQTCYVETDHTMRLAPGLEWCNANSGAGYSSGDTYPAGIYGLSFSTLASSAITIDGTGSVDTANNTFAVGDTGLAIGTGSVTITRRHAKDELDAFLAGSGTYYIPIGSRHTSNSQSDLSIDTGRSAYTHTVNTNAVHAFTLSGSIVNPKTLSGGSIVNAWTGGATSVSVVVTFLKQFTSPFKEDWTMTTTVTINSNSSTTYTAALAGTYIGLNTIKLGKEVTTGYSIYMDNTYPLFMYILQEVDHHIPIRFTQYSYNADTDDKMNSDHMLLKETNVSTLYTREELSSLLYSLMLSLFTVHATQREFKQA